MKKYIRNLKLQSNFIAIIALLGLFTSCEDVIDVKLDTAEPKLVVDASINWQKGTSGSYQRILLSTTTDFFSNDIPTVSNAEIFITNLNSGQIFNFIESSIDLGVYECFDFIPVINDEYELTIVYGNETFKAKEPLISVPTIEFIEQERFDVFGTALVQIKYFFQDNADEDNYYLSRFDNPNAAVPEYGVNEDRFTQGNLMSGVIIDDELEAGQELTISLHGISEQYFNYMRILLTIAGNGGGGPFVAPPATVRGNIINQNNFDNFALGYFRLSEQDVINYTIQ